MASPEVHEKVAALVEKIDVDRTVAEDEFAKLYTVTFADAATMANTLRTLVPDSAAPGQINHEPNSRSVVVVGPPSLHEQVKHYLAQLDVDPTKDLVEKVIDVRQVRGDLVHQSVSTLYSGERGTRISLDASGRKLLVRGPPDVVERIERLVGSLDSSGDGAALEPELYRMQHASAASVVASLQSLIPDLARLGTVRQAIPRRTP